MSQRAPVKPVGQIQDIIPVVLIVHPADGAQAAQVPKENISMNIDLSYLKRHTCIVTQLPLRIEITI